MAIKSIFDKDNFEFLEEHMEWLPAVKILLPYISKIITATLPVFKKTDGNSESINQTQIVELQDAVVSNAEATQLLAKQLQELILALDNTAVKVRREMLIIKGLSISALLVSLGSIVLWISTRT